MQFTLFEIEKLSAVGVGLLVLVLSFVHATKQSKVSRSLATSLMISIRFAIVYVGLFWFWCVLLRMPMDVFLILFGVCLGSVVLVCFGGVGHDLFSAAIAIVIAFPGFLLLGFIFWDSLFDMFVLRPPGAVSEPKDKSNDSQQHLNATGTVVATLKPTGTIEINGETHSAATENGKYLDVGATVEVCGYRNRIMLVRVVENADSAIS